MHDSQWSSVGEFSNQSLGVTGEGGGSSQEPPLNWLDVFEYS